MTGKIAVTWPPWPTVAFVFVWSSLLLCWKSALPTHFFVGLLLGFECPSITFFDMLSTSKIDSLNTLLSEHGLSPIKE